MSRHSEDRQSDRSFSIPWVMVHRRSSLVESFVMLLPFLYEKRSEKREKKKKNEKKDRKREREKDKEKR